MEKRSRYDVSDSDADLGGGVLKNKLQITDQQALNDAETILLQDLYVEFFEMGRAENAEFTIDFLLSLHENLFSVLYDWAGQLRSVNISKGGVLFAPAEHLKDAFELFGVVLHAQLRSEVPSSVEEMAERLTVVHNEFNAVHPFREGNGRVIRLFLDLVSVRCGFHLIQWNQLSRDDYIAACIEGMSQRHEDMQKLLLEGLK